MTNEHLSARIHHWMEHFRTHGTGDIDASAIAQTIGERGDVMLYGSKRKGEQVALIEQLAQGVAILSRCPGGVTFMGEHYESA